MFARKVAAIAFGVGVSLAVGLGWVILEYGPCSTPGIRVLFCSPTPAFVLTIPVLELVVIGAFVAAAAVGLTRIAWHRWVTAEQVRRATRRPASGG